MNKYTEAIQRDDVVILCDGIPMGVGELLVAPVPQPADDFRARLIALCQQWTPSNLDRIESCEEIIRAVAEGPHRIEMADAALADSIDSLGFVISGDNPPVKEWVSECGGGCMPATKEEKMMWDVLQSALRARAVPNDIDLWSFLRDVLKRGAAIESQFSQQGYEAFISEIEAAARKEDKRLRAMLAASKAGEGKERERRN